ncbi:MAG: hypothetical protein ABIR29_02450, partial [Chthoniobacterales bacterium]
GGTLQSTGTVTSSGTVDVGADSLSITGSGSYTQSAGTFRLASGSVTSSTALVFNGGLVDARGTINAAITNSANLQPALGSAAGLVVNGNVTLLAASNLTFQLSGLTQGTQSGFLNVNGTVALNGNLVVSFVNPFQAGNNDNFTVLSSTSLSGAFTNVASGSRLAATDNSGTFLVTYNGTTVILSDFQPLGETPASSSATASSGSGVAPAGKGARNSEGDTVDNAVAGSATPSVAVNTAAAADPGTTPAPQADPPTVASRRKNPAARGRSGTVTLKVRNTDQLSELLDGSGATTANGKVVVKSGAGRKASAQARSSADLPTSGNQRDQQPKIPDSHRTERLNRAVVGAPIAN